jgi:hypothetical protein
MRSAQTPCDWRRVAAGDAACVQLVHVWILDGATLKVETGRVYLCQSDDSESSKPNKQAEQTGQIETENERKKLFSNVGCDPNQYAGKKPKQERQTGSRFGR